VDLWTFDSPQHYLPILLVGAVLTCLVVAAYLALAGRPWLGTAAVALLAVGLVTRLVIGFSPTAFASGSRTFAFLYVALVAVLFLVAQVYLRATPRAGRWLPAALGLVATYTYGEALLAALGSAPA
jgi:hypothetical protein